MESAEIIALVAVAVTGISVLTNYLLSKQRLVHDEAMQQKRLSHESELQGSRLSHERAEAVRTTAATAYSKADAVVRHINPSTIHTIAENFEPGQEFGPRQVVQEAMDALGFVSALGWSAELRDAAEELLEAISKLASAAWATAGAIRRNNPNQVEMLDRIDERFDTAQALLDEYRKAVTGE